MLVKQWPYQVFKTNFDWFIYSIWLILILQHLIWTQLRLDWLAVPSVSVEGQQEKHVMAGSPVELKCFIQNCLKQPTYVFWWEALQCFHHLPAQPAVIKTFWFWFLWPRIQTNNKTFQTPEVVILCVSGTCLAPDWWTLTPGWKL